MDLINKLMALEYGLRYIKMLKLDENELINLFYISIYSAEYDEVMHSVLNEIYDRYKNYGFINYYEIFDSKYFNENSVSDVMTTLTMIRDDNKQFKNYILNIILL